MSSEEKKFTQEEYSSLNQEGQDELWEEVSGYVERNEVVPGINKFTLSDLKSISVF